MSTSLKSIQLDGEIMALSRETLEPLPLGELLKFKKLKEVDLMDMEDDPTKIIVVYIFDVLEVDGESLLMQELIQRRGRVPAIPALR